ncbi:MAG: amidohydrolase [Firmicutes bacterium]|nr:amidohydrolase [Bacillota bacterium]
MIKDLRQEIEALTPEIVEIRRDLHKHPETGFKEFRTSGIIKDYLKSLGMDTVQECAGTGVIATLNDGKPGRRAMILADIDALPMEEKSGEPFAAEVKDAGHCCGHDAHTAIQLGIANILAKHRDEIPGSVVFLFQPNEEDAGAQIMIDEGAVDMAGHPDAIFGSHNQPNLKLGTFGIMPGAIMASSYYYKITIHGKGGHGGRPHEAVNPVDASAFVVLAIKNLVTAERSALKPTVITNAMIHGGQKEITIPETCEMQGSIRCLHTEHEAVHARFKEVVAQACAINGCTCDIELKCGNSVCYNDPDLCALCADVIGETFGKESIIVDESLKSMGGDDYAEFLAYMPGIYMPYGISDDTRTWPSIHNPGYCFNEKAIPVFMEAQIRCVLKYLEQA